MKTFHSEFDTAEAREVKPMLGAVARTGRDEVLAAMADSGVLLGEMCAVIRPEKIERISHALQRARFLRDMSDAERLCAEAAQRLLAGLAVISEKGGDLARQCSEVFNQGS
ncbi:MAG: hypothetical protein ACSLFQ_10135 [Thermoanaerobaculia bacterium]